MHMPKKYEMYLKLKIAVNIMICMFKVYTLLLADVFENFRNMCLDIYGLGPVYFVSTSGLRWQACLRNTEVKLELLTDYDMILMVEKEITGGICQATHRYAKANSKHMKNYNKNIESSYMKYLDANNLYGWGMSQKRPTNGFKWVKQKKSLKALKKVLSHGLVLRKVHRVIQFKQKSWLKSYIDINTELRKKTKK